MSDFRRDELILKNCASLLRTSLKQKGSRRKHRLMATKTLNHQRLHLVIQNGISSFKSFNFSAVARPVL